MQWADVTAKPTDRVLRQFAGGLIVVGLTWTAWLFWMDEAPATRVVAALAGVTGLVGVVTPSAVRPIFRTWMIVAFPIGWLLSRTMLALLYFLLFTPVALAFRLMGRDVLGRRRTNPDSYWRTRTNIKDVKRYLQQF